MKKVYIQPQIQATKLISQAVLQSVSSNVIKGTSDGEGGEMRICQRFI